jgi:hemerythrin-like metal-binding protein
VLFRSQLGDVVQGQVSEWDQGAVLTALVDYTHTHFQFEEDLMRRVGYEETDSHVQQHHDLVRAVAAMVDAQARGEQADAEALVVFLRDWLTGHIMGTDRVLGQALNARGVR